MALGSVTQTCFSASTDRLSMLSGVSVVFVSTESRSSSETPFLYVHMFLSTNETWLRATNDNAPDNIGPYLSERLVQDRCSDWALLENIRHATTLRACALTSISSTVLLPISLNPIFNQSGLIVGGFTPSDSRARFGGTSKCGVILVR